MTVRVGAHSVYRMFDAEGALLYVGCTAQWPLRLDQHRVGRPWWQDVATVTIESFPSREDALDAESRAIEVEHPLHNADRSAVAKENWGRRLDAQKSAHARGVYCDEVVCAACRPRRRAEYEARS